MDVSRLSISQETQMRLSQAHVLTRKQRRAIRINAIKELLESHPSTREYGVREIMSAAGYRIDQYQAGYDFVKNLVAKGILIKYPVQGTVKSRYVFIDKNELKKRKKVVYDTIPNKTASDEEDGDVKNEIEVAQSNETNYERLHCEKEKNHSYTMHFTLERRPESSEEFGSKRIASIEMTGLSIEQIKEMIEETLSRVN